MRKHIPIVLAVLAPVVAWGQAISLSELPPAKWIEQVIPEKLPGLKYPEYADTAERARIQLQAGRNRLALQTIRLAKDVTPVQRMEIEGEALYRLGRYQEAVEVLSGPVKATPAALRTRAMAMAELGQRKEAIALLEKMNDPSPITHGLIATLYEQGGQVGKAREALKWFVRQKYLEGWRENELEKVESADDLVTIASGLDRVAVYEGMYRSDASLHNEILAMFVKAYDVLDRRNADAHVAAARFFLAHDDAEHAQQEVEKALTINPNHIAAWLIVGGKAMQSQDTADADKAIATIRQVNPEHPAATELDVRMLVVLRQRQAAVRELAPLLLRDPGNAQLQALAAMIDTPDPDPAVLEKRLEQISAMMPESALAATEAGRTLITLNQHHRAIPVLQEAIRKAPNWNLPRNLLAQAYMLGTDLEKARPVLEEAHNLDPFSVDTTNYLRMLDLFTTFQTHTSEHFAVRFNPRTDPFLADEILAYMEQNYRRICGNFGAEPTERTFIELMPENEDFSVRFSGRPWHATYAVTLGPVITIIAPRKGGKTIGNFDWTDVLRHEFVHTINLDQTQGRIPRWLTEGLAVSEQSTPLWHSRVEVLAKAGAMDKFLPVRAMDQAIVSGKAPELGYSQGHWICKYIQETRGYATVLAMLKSYRDGLTTDEVFRQNLGMLPSEFDSQFAAWAKQQLQKIGMDAISQQKLEVLKKQGQEQLTAKDYAGALKTWEQACAVCPVDPMVHERLAGLYLSKQINQPEKALPHLHALDGEQLKDNRFALRLARLYDELKRPKDALVSARRATEINAYDANARQVLAKLLEETADTAGAQEQEKIIAVLSGGTEQKSSAGSGQ